MVGYYNVWMARIGNRLSRYVKSPGRICLRHGLTKSSEEITRPVEHGVAVEQTTDREKRKPRKNEYGCFEPNDERTDHEALRKWLVVVFPGANRR